MKSFLLLIRNNFSKNKMACIFGILHFTLFTFELIGAYLSIPSCQSVIFMAYADPFYVFPNIPVISPVVVAIIYFLGLTSILYSIKKKKLGYGLITVDATFSILLLLLFKNVLLHFIPFTYEWWVEFNSEIGALINLCYLTIIVSIVFYAAWLLHLRTPINLNKRQRDIRQFKNSYLKAILYFILIIISYFILYIVLFLLSFYIL